MTIPIRIATYIEGTPCEFEVSFARGVPAVGPSYSHGGLPPEPPEVEILRIYDEDGYESDYLMHKYYQLPEEEMEALYNKLVDRAEEIDIDTQAEIERERGL